jgi:hypothetical protein
MLLAFPHTIFPFLADDLDAEWSLGLGPPPTPARA